MKIGFFVQSTYTQGVYYRYHSLARVLQNLGHEVTIYGFDNKHFPKFKEEYRDKIQYTIIGSDYGQRFFSPGNHPLTALRRVLLYTYPYFDVIHLFEPALSGALPWMYLRTKAKVIVYDWCDLWTDGIIKKDLKSFSNIWTYYLTKFIEKKVLVYADGVTVISRYLHHRALEGGAKSIKMLYNGIWEDSIKDKKMSRKFLNLQEDAVYIGYMGRTIFEIDWCIDALTDNLDAFPNLRLALCGMREDLFDDLPYYLRDKIDCLGHLPVEKLTSFASALDFGLLPLEDNAFNNSRFPLKFTDYLASGVPIICSAVGECALVGKNLQGCNLSGPTRQAWRTTVTEVLNEFYAGNYINFVANSFYKQFSWESVTLDLISFYEELICNSCN